MMTKWSDGAALSQIVEHPLYVCLSLFRVFVELEGNLLRPTDDDRTDKLPVNVPLRFPDNHRAIGILLVDDEVAGEGLASLNEGFNGLFLEIKGDAEYGRVPLLEQFGRHMGTMLQALSSSEAQIRWTKPGV